MKCNAPADGNWCVYIVRCVDGTLYTGVAKDVAARLERHNAGKAAKYTRSRLPVELIHVEPAGGRGAALRRELEIKRMGRVEKEKLANIGKPE